MRTLLPLLLLLPVVSCAPDYDNSPVKLVGVGYDPDEIGPAPTPYGGVVEYSWVNFAGAGLSLALMGLGSFAEVGPDMVGYSPPYAAVYGFSYIFDTKITGVGALGVTSPPPEVEDTCYTTFEAGGPVGSFKTVDVGSWMELTTDDGTGGLRMSRSPSDYPNDEQDMVVNYFSFDFWAADPVYGKVAGDGDRPGSMTDTVLRRRNFPFGEDVAFKFPGAMARMEAPIGSMPRPSASVPSGNTTYTLPAQPGGVQVLWSGPLYDAYGHTSGSGDQSTCLSYAPPGAVPADATDCDGADHPPSADFTGQTYTGPWDTDDGQVIFRWNPGGLSVENGGNPDEFVSLSVRFLGAVDRTDTFYLEHVVEVEPNGKAASKWAAESGIPAGTAQPNGRRAPTACEEDADGKKAGAWVFDDAYEDAEGNYSPALHGDPFHNLSEVTCRLADDGEFVLTNAIVEQALTYAREHHAEGAVFYLTRSTEAEATVPLAKDQYNQRLDISPVKITSRAVEIGRFWFEE